MFLLNRINAYISIYTTEANAQKKTIACDYRFFSEYKSFKANRKVKIILLL